MADEALALSREEVLARVRACIQAAARGPLSPADAKDLTQEALELLRAALDDPELLDALLEEEGLRELLEDPATRERLLAVLQQRTAWERVQAWFENPATLLDLAALVLLGVVALASFARLALPTGPLGHRPVTEQHVGAPLSPDHVTRLLELPEQLVVPAGLEIVGRPAGSLAPADPLLLRLGLRAPARVVLLEQRADGSVAQAWPALGQAPALVPPPEAGGPAIQLVSLIAPPQEGTHRLRLVVVPVDLDLGILTLAALQGVAARLTVVDLRYQVTRP